jgi:hypothetical protein
MSSEIQALFVAMQSALSGAATGNWGTRCWANMARASETRPYLVYGVASVTETGDYRHSTLDVVIDVAVIADTQAEAFAGASAAYKLLNDHGLNDRGTIHGDSSWRILTVSRESVIHLVELIDGAQVYQAGGRYRIVMEEI